MSLTAAALKMMAEKGLTAHDIADIAAANEKRIDPTSAKRQARFRAKAKSNGVTVTRNAPNDIILNPSEPIGSNEPIPPEDENPVLLPEHVVEVWNDLAARRGLKAVTRLSAERRATLKTRIGQNRIEDFQEAIAAIDRSPFLCGENDRRWKAYFDWMLKPANFTKLIEGTYDR